MSFRTRTLSASVVLASGVAFSALACDGNDDPQIGTDVFDASETIQDTTPDGALDTALPFEIVQENRDLRNGAKARVGHVIDGDTLQVWVGTSAPKSYTIRMLGLAAPERDKDYRLTPDGSRLVCTSDDEYYGLASYEIMKGLVEDKQVTVTCDVAANAWCGQDPFDRYLAYLVTADGKDAAVELARAGGAFSYTDFTASKRADICRAEYEARDADRGMWVLGSVSQVLAGMHSNTRGWYNSNHDSRCNQAISADN